MIFKLYPITENNLKDFDIKDVCNILDIIPANLKFDLI